MTFPGGAEPSAPPSGGRRLLAGVLVLCVALAVTAVAARWYASPGGEAWSLAVADAVAPWERGGWRVFRGGLKWIVPPTLVVVVVVATVRTVRAGRRRTAIWSLATGATTFAVVELVKLAPAPVVGATGRTLSGHVAATAAALVVVVAATQGPARRLAAVVGLLALVGVGVAVVVARWHDVGDVVVAATLCGGTAAVSGALVAGVTPRRRETWQVPCAVVVALGANWWLVAHAGPPRGTTGALTVAALTVAMTMVAVVVVQRAAVDGRDPAGRATRSAPAGAGRLVRGSR